MTGDMFQIVGFLKSDQPAHRVHHSRNAGTKFFLQFASSL